jgi:hypothetical protein
MAFLRVISGAKTGQLWELPESKAVLGRHPDCHIEINTPVASRHHAQIVFRENAHFVEDLHSRNGTFVNDEQICSRHKLCDGDRLRISDLVFQFYPGNYLGWGAGGCGEGNFAAATAERDSAGRLAFASRPAGDFTSANAGEAAALQRQLHALQEVARHLRKALALDCVLPQILEALFGIFPAADRGIIVLRGDGGQIVPRWVKHREGGVDAEACHARISRTIIEGAMTSQQGLLSVDAVADSRFSGSQSVATVSIRSLMCAALLDGDGTSFGAIQLDSVRERDRFRDQDLEVFLSAAIQASIAIDNARLHDDALRQCALECEKEAADQLRRGLPPQDPPELPG